MTLLRSDIRAKLYHVVPGLGLVGVADDIGPDSIVDSFTFENAEGGTGDYESSYIYRPTLSTNDRVKPAGLVSGAALKQVGAAYLNQVATAYEVVGLIHPDELNDCIRRAQRRIFFETYTPLTPWADGDFSANDPGPWQTNQVNTVCSLSSTQENNYSGILSLVCTNSGANGYTTTEPLYVSPGDRITLAAINRVTGSWTAYMRLWDMTHDAEIGSPLSHSNQNWQHLIRTDTVPEGCYELRLRLQGLESGAVVVWDSLPGHNLDTRRFKAPDWLDEGFKLLSFGPTEYGRALDTGRHNADSKRYLSWYRPDDFDMEPLSEDASPRTLVINRDHRLKLPEQDLWLHGKRAYSDRGELTNETDTTEAPEDLVMAAAQYEVGVLLMDRYPDDPEWPRMVARTELVLAGQRQARPQIQPRRERFHYAPGGRVGLR